MVRGRHPQRLRQLHRPASEEARQADRHHLRARRPRARGEAHHLSRAAQGRLPLGQRAEGERGQARRPGDDLSADDPGSGLRHARLRADRRHPFRRVRRLLAGLARRAHRGLQIALTDHRRRRPARRPQGCAQGQCRCGAEEGRRRRQGSRRQAHRRAGAVDAGPRSLARAGTRQGRRRLSGRGDERRGPAVHPLHLGLDRTAQGRAAHIGRLSRVRRDDASIRVRLSRRRHLLVHRRCRLGDGPLLHRLRSAGERGDDADLRGCAELSRRLALLASRRQAQGQYLLHRARRRSGR